MSKHSEGQELLESPLQQNKSGRPKKFYEKYVFKNFAKLTGKLLAVLRLLLK